jgi:hypothetical protein
MQYVSLRVIWGLSQVGVIFSEVAGNADGRIGELDESVFTRQPRIRHVTEA